MPSVAELGEEGRICIGALPLNLPWVFKWGSVLPEGRDWGGWSLMGQGGCSVHLNQQVSAFPQ